jgi:hypothetical protein
MRGIWRQSILLVGMFFIASCAVKKPEGQTRCAQSFDGETISYNVYGDGEITLVFVHGWSCDSRYWREQVPYFAKKYKVVTVDLAGHGHSSQNRKIYSVESFAQDVNAVIDSNRTLIRRRNRLGSGEISTEAGNRDYRHRYTAKRRAVVQQRAGRQADRNRRIQKGFQGIGEGVCRGNAG